VAVAMICPFMPGCKKKNTMDHSTGIGENAQYRCGGLALNNYALIAIALVTFGAIPLVALRMLGRQRHIVERILIWCVLSLWCVGAFATLRAFIIFAHNTGHLPF
jgi:hypothetical protein